MNLLDLFTPIRTFIFDVDGVLTNGTMLATEEGHLLRSMNIKDGYALQLAVKKGYQVCIISGARSEGIRIRLNRLGIENVHLGIESKKEILHEYVNKVGSGLESVLYMGDDIPDYAVMKLCGLPCCPQDAVPEIRELSKYVSPFNGGAGCVRDVIEKVLKLNGHWDLPE